MSTNPRFDYTVFILDGLKKGFPILTESDPQEIAEWLYETVSAFSGRDGRCLSGGGEDDIRCLVAAASGVALEVPAGENPREIKDALSTMLRRAWLSNDHATIFYVARGFERNASMSVVNYRNVGWVDPYRVVEEDEEKGIEISEEIEEWIGVLTEPSETRSVIGNRTRKRLRRKPAERAVKSLFEGDL